MLDVDVKGAAKVLADEAGQVLAPIVSAAVQTLSQEILKLGPALIEQLDGLTITCTITRKPQT